MHALEHGTRALRAEARRQSAALRDRRLWVTLGVFAAILALAAQFPLSYDISIGREEGAGGDRPMIVDFHDPESSELAQDKFRWTTERSSIRLPGFGQRALQATLRLLPVSQEVAEHGPKTIELWVNGTLLAQLPVRPTTGGVYRFVMAPVAGAGDQLIELRSGTFTPSGDARAIGTPVDDLRVESSAGPVLPPWRHDLAWLGAALLFWLALRRIGFTPSWVQRFLLVGLALGGLAAWLDPPRFAFGSGVALIIAALGWLLVVLLAAEPIGLLLAGAALALPAIVLRFAGTEGTLGQIGAVLAGTAVALLLAGWLRPAIANAYVRIAPPIPAAAQRWLLLIALVVFASHYGGKIYPDSMWGDIGFHYNRYVEVLRGIVLLLSRNRGVDFPYPPAFYLLLAPLALTGLDPHILLQLVGALLDALSPFLIYAIVAGVACRSPMHLTQVNSAVDAPAQLGLIAAAIYSLSAATMMTTWWNFSTHIFTQFAHLLLIAMLVLLWELRMEHQEPRTDSSSNLVLGSRFSVLSILFLLQALVYLGHFGFWMNMSLLGGLGLTVVLIGALRRRIDWATFRLLLAAFVAAELFAAVFFYSSYAGLFLAQAQATASGGLTGLAGRPAINRAILWRTLWDAGFRLHFGFFPVPLALCGLALLWRRKTESRIDPVDSAGARSRFSVLSVLMSGTFLIALLFASLPFISGSTLSTRWLMFSAWVIAVGAALVAQILWRYGRGGRLLVLVMGGYIFWVTASMWLQALAWRVRPPEPF
jgi:hypothetical protein